MRILLVAPAHADLPSVVVEVAAISSFHEVERVIGTVRESDIQRAIEKGDYDVLWWASHGGPEGLLLSGSILSAEGVGQFVSASGAKLCVLNTCASEDVAFRIIAGGDADMVFTISADVGDADALRFGSLLAGELAKTNDFEDAFRTAAGPGATKYRYLKAKQALRGLALQAATELERLQDKVEVLANGQYKLTVDLAALVTRFDQMTQQALLSQQQALQAQSGGGNMASLDRRLMNNQPFNGAKPLSFPPAFWATLLLIVLILGLVVFFAGRGF